MKYLPTAISPSMRGKKLEEVFKISDLVDAIQSVFRILEEIELSSVLEYSVRIKVLIDTHDENEVARRKHFRAILSKVGIDMLYSSSTEFGLFCQPSGRRLGGTK